MEAQRLLHQPLASADASTLAPHVEEAPNFDGVDLLRNGSAPAAETSRALKGFYALTVSLEVFAVVSLVLFLPILLEQVAREHGFLAPDHTLPCPPSSSSRPHVPLDGRTGKSEPARCAVRLLGGWLDTASFSMLTYSASVALQALTVISLGSRADDVHSRRRLLFVFTVLGAGTTMAFLVLPTSTILWPLAALFAIVANVSFGASAVSLNAYLPALAASAPSVISASDRLDSAADEMRRSSASTSSGTDRLMRSQGYIRAREAYGLEKARVTAAISSRSIAAGYAAGIVVLVVLLVPVTLLRGSTFSLRFSLFVSGVWWAAGATLSLVWLRSAAIETRSEERTETEETTAESVRRAWRSLGRLIREWHRLPQTFVFLGAWFLLSDGFSTITSTAMLFGKTTLNMSTSELVVIAVLTPASGMAGAFAIPRVQLAREWSNVQTLRVLVVAATLAPVWGLFALRRTGEMYALAVVFGSIYGAFQAYARSCFAAVIPISQSATWFGLYSVTDKSSSFFGPLLVAVITNVTGEVRYGFWIILALMLVALCLPLALFDIEKGSDDAEAYEQEAARVFDVQ